MARICHICIKIPVMQATVPTVLIRWSESTTTFKTGEVPETGVPNDSPHKSRLLLKKTNVSVVQISTAAELRLLLKCCRLDWTVKLVKWIHRKLKQTRNKLTDGPMQAVPFIPMAAPRGNHGHE